MRKKLNFFFLYNITTATTMNLISCSCIVPEAKIELTKIIKNTDLGSIYTGQRTFLKQDELLKVIQTKNTLTKDLNLEDFQIKDQNNNTVTILGLKQYTGQVTLKYKIENWKKIKFNNFNNINKNQADISKVFDTSSFTSNIINNNFAFINNSLYYLNKVEHENDSNYENIYLWKITNNKNEYNIRNIYKTENQKKEKLLGFWPVNNKIYILVKSKNKNEDEQNAETTFLIKIDTSTDQPSTLKEWKEISTRPTALIYLNKTFYLLFIGGYKKFDINSNEVVDTTLTFKYTDDELLIPYKKIIEFNNYYFIQKDTQLELFIDDDTKPKMIYSLLKSGKSNLLDQKKIFLIKNFVIINGIIFCLITDFSRTIYKVMKITNFIDDLNTVVDLYFETREKIINIVAIDNILYVVCEGKIIIFKNINKNKQSNVFWESKNEKIGLLDKDTKGNLYAIIKKDNNDVDWKISEKWNS